MTENYSAVELKKVLQNKKLENSYTPYELVKAIHENLENILLMELVNLDKLQVKAEVARIESSDETSFMLDFFFYNENKIYISNINKHQNWLNIKLSINYNLILLEIVNNYYSYGPVIQHLFSLEHGELKGHLTLNSNFDKMNFLSRLIDVTEYRNDNFNGLEISIEPNKQLLAKELEKMNQMYGGLNVDIKRIIIEALIASLNDIFISRELLDLIKIHPETPEDLKALISLSIS